MIAAATAFLLTFKNVTIGKCVRLITVMILKIRKLSSNEKANTTVADY